MVKRVMPERLEDKRHIYSETIYSSGMLQWTGKRNHFVIRDFSTGNAGTILQLNFRERSLFMRGGGGRVKI